MTTVWVLFIQEARRPETNRLRRVSMVFIDSIFGDFFNEVLLSKDVLRYFVDFEVWL